MALLDLLKKTIQGNAILGAALRDGSIRIIYKHPPEIDEERLFRTWTIEVLIVDDSTYNGLINTTLERLGWTTRRKGDKITATKDEAITPAERKQMEAEDEAEETQKQVAATEKREDLLLQTLEAMQARIDDLEERLEFMSLVKSKGTQGPAGAPGERGLPGRDGQDLAAGETKLQDLADVSDEDPRQGQILMWQEIDQSWELRFPPQSGGGSGGGGGGGGTGGGTGLEHWYEDDEGNFLPKTSPTPPIAIDGNATDGIEVDGNGEGVGANLDGNAISPVTGGQNIGSETQPIGSLYAAGNTVFLDNKPLNLRGDARLMFNGDVLSIGDISEEDLINLQLQIDALKENSIEVPTEISEYPTNYANLVVDLDTGKLVAVEPEDLIAPE